MGERPHSAVTLSGLFLLRPRLEKMEEATYQKRSSGDASAQASSSSLEDNFCEHRRRQNREAQRRYRSTTGPQLGTVAAGSLES